jgi:hypothetical protein
MYLGERRVREGAGGLGDMIARERLILTRQMNRIGVGGSIQHTDP